MVVSLCGVAPTLWGLGVVSVSVVSCLVSGCSSGVVGWVGGWVGLAGVGRGWPGLAAYLEPFYNSGPWLLWAIVQGCLGRVGCAVSMGLE